MPVSSAGYGNGYSGRRDDFFLVWLENLIGFFNIDPGMFIHVVSDNFASDADGGHKSLAVARPVSFKDISPETQQGRSG